MAERRRRTAHTAPMSIYEVHLGSWRRVPEEGDRFLDYRELAEQLADYVTAMGFTHVELLPVTEHPFYASWGYQTIGYYAPTRRYGTPARFHGLRRPPAPPRHRRDPRLGARALPQRRARPRPTSTARTSTSTPIRRSASTRTGARASSTTGAAKSPTSSSPTRCFWLERYHIDGLRVDAVASMIYRDYSRKAGEWIPNMYGGRENLEALAFLRRVNEVVYADAPRRP